MSDSGTVAPAVFRSTTVLVDQHRVRFPTRSAARSCFIVSYPTIGTAITHLFRSVANDAAEECLLEIRDDLARSDHHPPEGHHLVDVLRVQVPQRLHLPQVVRANLHPIPHIHMVWLVGEKTHECAFSAGPGDAHDIWRTGVERWVVAVGSLWE